jgi:lipoprotein-anchoring transpeptidase ErfK/SrfK
MSIQGFGQDEQLRQRFGEEALATLINVDLRKQELSLIKGGAVRSTYPISSAKNGPGQELGSGMTPLGLHYVREKIGEGQNPFAIFVSRLPTGEIAKEQKEGTAIVGRILWLSGLEEEFNCGKTVDTYRRYIYIHGTNDISRLGQPVSAGCIRMHPEHIVELFDQIPINTLVYISA